MIGNMAKYKVKTRGYQLIVKARLALKEKLDEGQFTLFSDKNIRGLLRPKRLGRNAIQYSGPVGISLAERLKKPVNKYDFLFIMEQIVVIFQKLKANSLAAGHLILDVRYVFINETTKEVLFIYLPLEQAGEGADIFAFMESVIYSVTSAQEDDMDYISRFVYFIKSLNTYDGDRIERFIKSEDKSVVSTIKRHDTRKSSPAPDQPADGQNRNGGRSGAAGPRDRGENAGRPDRERSAGPREDEESTGLLDNEESTRVLEDEESTGLLEDEEATGLLEDEEATGLLEDEEATGLLEDEEATGLLEEQPQRSVSLRRLRTDEVIWITGPVFRIGKGKNSSDYIVRDNEKVSRTHADIVTRGDRYFIMDLKSTNRTFINGRPIPAQQEMEIFDGDHLKLADEEFEFRI